MNDLMESLLSDINELEAPWDLITESVATYIEGADQNDRPRLIADYTLSISKLHALEAIAKALTIIAQKEN